MKKEYKILVGKPEGKTPLEKPSHIWENITMNLETMCEGMNWIHLAKDKGQWQTLVNTVVNLQVP
jgi:hypothetical protein